MTKAKSSRLGNFLIENHTRIDSLVTKFAGGAANVDRVSIGVWLEHFDEADWLLALKLLESVDYYSRARILEGCRVLHEQALPLASPGGGNVYVASFGWTAGKSGDVILYSYRVKNNLSAAEVIKLTDVLKFADDPSVGFIFVDDFVGSGEQAVGTWKNIVGFLNRKQKTVLAVHVAFEEGIKRIRSETRLEVVCNKLLSEGDKVFSEENTAFTAEQKATLLSYCHKADDSPKGYKEMQANVVFNYRAPDNAISILRSNDPKWKGLFPRKL